MDPQVNAPDNDQAGLTASQKRAARIKEARKLRQEAKNQRPIIIAETGGKCAACDFALSSLLDVHHIVPIMCGGSSDPTNLVALCANCHIFTHNAYELCVLFGQQTLSDLRNNPPLDFNDVLSSLRLSKAKQLEKYRDIQNWLRGLPPAQIEKYELLVNLRTQPTVPAKLTNPLNFTTYDHETYLTKKLFNLRTFVETLTFSRHNRSHTQGQTIYFPKYDCW